MSSRGIRDKVAIVGMACTPFGELWDKSVGDLVIDAVHGAVGSAHITVADVDAYWWGSMVSGTSGLPVSRALRLDHKPVTRVENMCASGSESLRQACYAVASGAYDVAVAVGAEKLKDSGYSGLVMPELPFDGTDVDGSAPARFSLLVAAYCQKYGLDEAQMRAVLTHIARKNHDNGALNALAQFRERVTTSQIEHAPLVAGMLRLFDCSGVADGAAAAVVVPADMAYDFTDKPLFVKALALAAGPGTGFMDQAYDFTTFPEVTRSAGDAYAQAGVTDPRRELALAEVHDCFTPTELVLSEDLGFAARGEGWKDYLSGSFDRNGDLPINPDGGLKAFGHPIGASGLRMMFECWLQLRGEAPAERRVATQGRSLALTHNLGGQPGDCVSFVSIVGTERDL